MEFEIIERCAKLRSNLRNRNGEFATCTRGRKFGGGYVLLDCVQFVYANWKGRAYRSGDCFIVKCPIGLGLVSCLGVGRIARKLDLSMQIGMGGEGGECVEKAWGKRGENAGNAPGEGEEKVKRRWGW